MSLTNTQRRIYVAGIEKGRDHAQQNLDVKIEISEQRGHKRGFVDGVIVTMITMTALVVIFAVLNRI